LRNKIILSLFIFFCTEIKASAQSALTDSLEKALIYIVDHKEKIDVMLQLSKNYRNINLEKALFYAKTAFNLSERIGDEKAKAESYILLATAYTEYANYTLANEYLQKSLAISEKINHKVLKAEAYNAMGSLHWAKGDYRSAFDFYLRTLMISESIKDSVRISSSYNNLGVIHSSMENLDLGLYYFFKALKYTKPNEFVQISNRYRNIAGIYFQKKLYRQSLYYLEEARKIYEKLQHDRGMALTLFSISQNYKAMGKIEIALDTIFKAVEISNRINNPRTQAVNYIVIGTIYMDQGKYKEAIAYSLKAMKMAEKISAKAELIEIYKQLSKSYAALKEFNTATKYFEQYNNLNIALYNEQNYAQMNEMNMLYESEKKDSQLKILNKKNVIKQSELKKQSIIKNASIGSCILIVFITFVLYRNGRLSRYTNKLLQERNFEITAQKENLERQKILLEDHTLKLQKENVLAQYETLKNQVNPHFLFNSLNAISSLILTNPQKAVEFTNQFSKVYSYILDLKENLLIKVEEELKLVNSYCFLQKIRFGESLHVHMDVSDEHMKGSIPPFSLQLLVENAIKHNIISVAHPLRISVKSEQNYLTVTNNLQKRTENITSTGIGLKNLTERYHIVSTEAPKFWSNGSEYIANIPVIL
jgi:tetratricopeptide (TPR) repeat protein